MEFCDDWFICYSRKYQNFHEGNFIDNKFVGIFMYKMSICTKYHILCKNIMKIIKMNELP